MILSPTLTMGRCCCFQRAISKISNYSGRALRSSIAAMASSTSWTSPSILNTCDRKSSNPMDSWILRRMHGAPSKISSSSVIDASSMPRSTLETTSIQGRRGKRARIFSGQRGMLTCDDANIRGFRRREEETYLSSQCQLVG
jgi:hypothetical protein